MGKLPPNHIVPLISAEGKISVAVDLICKILVHGGFTRWAHGNRLLQLALAAMCDPRHFGGEAVDMVLFPGNVVSTSIAVPPLNGSLFKIVT